MNPEHVSTVENPPQRSSQISKKRAFGVGFWLILVASLIATAAACIEFIAPGTLSQVARSFGEMVSEISAAAKQGGKQLLIAVFWRVIVPAYFIFYTILPILLFQIIRRMRIRIAALETLKGNKQAD